MEHINIISKEEITNYIDFPVHIACALSILGLFIVLILYFKTKNLEKFVKGTLICGLGGLVLMLITMIVCSTFFRVPTGRYKYIATINEDTMTVSQYNEFIKQYHPFVRDGLYYWED